MFRNWIRRLSLRKRRPFRFEQLENRDVPATLFGVTLGSNQLVSFDSALPGTLISNVGITGLSATESIEGIDFRPATGQLYGLGVDGTTARIGTINPVSGAFTAIGSTFTVAGAADYGFDFNPTIDRIRMTSSGQENFVINPNDGVVSIQTPLNPGTPSVVGSAYSNNFANATTTTLFDIDSGTDELLTQVPATGVLSSVGALGVNTSGDVGFDISGSGTAYASLTVGAGSQLYTIDTTTGAATLVGSISPGPVVLRGLAVGRFTWDGGGFDANWQSDLNWVGDIAPSPGDDLYFPTGAAQLTNTNNYAAGTIFSSINFTGNGYKITGNGITLDRGLTDSSTGGTNQFDLDIALSATQIFSVAQSSETVTLGGVISGGVGANLIKEKVAATTNNAGTLRFNGTASNTYLGSTGVNGGTLELAMTGGSVGILGSLAVGDGTGGVLADVVRELTNNNIADTANIDVFSSGLLAMDVGLSDTFNALTMTGGKVDSNTGSFSIVGGIIATSDAAGLPALIAGELNVGAGTISVSDGAVAGTDLTISAILSGSAGMTYSSDGQTLLTGSSINTYTGLTTVQSGTLILGRLSGSNPVTSNLIVGDGVGAAGSAVVQYTSLDNISDTGDVTVNSDGLFDLNDGSDVIGKYTSVGGSFVAGLGTLNTADLSLDSNSSFGTDIIDETTLGHFNVTGTVNVGGTLNVTLPTPPPTGSKFILIDNDGADAVTGTFNGLAEGAKFTVSGTEFTITYKGGDGNDVELSAGVAPTFTSAAATIFQVGSLGSFTITTNGTPIPAISNGSTLPAGVTFVDNGDGTAKLSGTPTENGVFFLNLTADNNIAPDATQFFTLTVEQAPAFTSANTFTATFGAAFNFTVTTVGFPTPPINQTGTLPTGVTFTDNGDGTGTLAGTPTQSGSFAITFSASNGVNPDASQNFTLNVNQAPAITSANNFTALFGTAFNFPVTASGFPNSAFSFTGTLPTGVTFTDNADGTAKIAGTPTQNGQFVITITANNGVAPNAQQSFTLTVNQAPTFSSANNFTALFGTAFNFPVTVTGFPNATFSFTGTPPTGVTFTDNGNGTAKISGTPTQSGVFNLTLKATNGVNPDATQSFKLTVNQAPAITSLGTITLTKGVAFSFPVTTTGFPTPAISTSGLLPNGVTFTDNGNGTGTISGTPTQGGVFGITITAANGVSPDATQSMTIKVTESLFAVGAGPGGLPIVNVYNSDGSIRFSFFAYSTLFAGGVSVATADVNGDGVDDIITGAGPGGTPHVMVYDGTNLNVLQSFLAYDSSFTGGVFVAGGDTDADGRADVVTGADAGGGSHVKVFSGSTQALLLEWFAYDPEFRGGVRVAAGDVTGDGRADVITGAGPGGGPHVIAFSGVDRSIARSFYAYDPAFSGGVYVSAGYVNNDSNADIITGVGSVGGPQVVVYSGADLTLLQSFYAYDPAFTGGVRVASHDLDGDGFADIVTGAGKGGASQVQVFRGTDLTRLNSFLAFDPAFLGGVFVG